MVDAAQDPADPAISRHAQEQAPAMEDWMEVPDGWEEELPFN